MFAQFISERIDKKRDSLHMGEFFLILGTLTQAAKVCCMETADEILEKVGMRIQYLKPKQERVLKSIALSKWNYMKGIGIEIDEDYSHSMADWSLYEIIQELLNCVQGNHIIRKSLYRKTGLINAVYAVVPEVRPEIVAYSGDSRNWPVEKHSLKVTVTT